ncbi:CaiB/BaiF CoA-transferase family protein [uncultured Desulfosarcina sp.]|uniref:CaiB/BaiF CoA transferase family protein n=1 Tax=uncultured Desulfosarcina sp. TaxID=218289 RepID=UPI0029C745B8|nr:CaiB/BaiF CoA-transferase family protein [uncultured Desulfosarcina sp.]
MNPSGALSGITVIDLSRLLPGPYCTMLLADHGARVIAVEDPRYRESGEFVAPVYRNKRHMTLNLKSDTGREIFFKLVKNADVVVQGFRPGVVKRLGVDYASVCRTNPEIVYCSITGYGQTGSMKHAAGHDVNYLSHAGLLDLMGEKNRPPAIPGIQVADLVGGGMNGALGILMALFHRERTGHGQHIDISMTDGMLGLLPAVQFFQALFGTEQTRGDTFLAHRYACYNTYATADGRYLAVGTVENRFWQNLCDCIGKPEYGPLQYDEARREEIVAFLRSTFKSKSLDQWEREFEGLDVCVSPVRTVAEALGDPLFAQREMIREMEGGAAALGIPVKLGETPGRIDSAPPAFGEHTDRVLGELGYGQQEIQQLRQEGVV